MKRMFVLLCVLLIGCSNIKNLPPVVKEAVLEEVSGIKLIKYSSWKEDGKTLFNVIGKKDNKKYVITVDENGKLLNVHIEF